MGIDAAFLRLPVLAPIIKLWEDERASSDFMPKQKKKHCFCVCVRAAQEKAEKRRPGSLPLSRIIIIIYHCGIVCVCVLIILTASASGEGQKEGLKSDAALSKTREKTEREAVFMIIAIAIMR